ncbi:MAG: transglycosylase domain-containing protein [Mogibacterium sp.]|nr:transglycosylase domain-containing protein [Mogibacterium sp.]
MTDKTNETESKENTESTEYVESVVSTENVENVENAESTESVESTGNIDNAENSDASDDKEKINFSWKTFDDNAKKRKGMKLFGFMKKKPARKRKFPIWLRVLLCLFFVLVLAATGLFAYAYYSVPSIDPGTSTIYSNIDLSSFIYDAKGKEIDKLYYTEDREIVSIKDIPENTKNAFIAIEDKTFYKHHGLNYKRLIGAVLSKLTGRSSEISGTSTITQQLARNVFLADIKSQRTVSRKVREMIYALKIEKAFSKDEILEAYLNTIYLGYGCYGIKSAAYTYFGKDVEDLTLAESAALAALPQAPDTYALLKDEADDNTTYLKKYGLYANGLSVERRDLVLDLMAEQGFVEPEKAEKAKKKLSKILHPHIAKKPKELTYFTDYLTAQVTEDLMKQYSMTKDEAEMLIHTGGLRIYSTIDQDIQRAINTEFSDDYNFPYAEEDPQAAMVVTEVGTGRIRAMVGGRNTSGQMLFNRATSPRQPGSSIKPLAVYSAALQKSEEYAQRGQTFPFTDFGIDRQGVYRWGKYITAGSTVVDERLFINGEVWPLNFSRGFSGYRTFRTALQQSINTCAVKIQLQVGADYSMEMLRKYGLTTLADDASEPTNDYNPAALALGAMTYGATPLDMAIAYGAFPNRGVRNSPAAYTKVTNSKGKDLLVKKVESTKVLDENVAFIMRDCLISVVTRGIARNAYIYGTEVGGKTGTTNDDYDYWFVGFTPKYSAALWIGTDHNVEMSSSSASAALLWSRIMEQIPDITEGEYPPQPEDVVTVYGEYYTEKTKPY